MQNFTPYEKLSKKARKEQDALQRGTWGTLNPVTRKPVRPKAYNRKKARKWRDDSMTVPFAMPAVVRAYTPLRHSATRGEGFFFLRFPTACQ